jgi:hypothetical protein
VEVFTYFNANDLAHVNFSIIVEYILCLPGSNAPVERVFSHMNKIWSSEKTQLGVSVLKAIFITKGNIIKIMSRVPFIHKNQTGYFKEDIWIR